MRGKLSKEAASGHNIITAADMKSAIDLHGGTTGCQASHVELLEKPSPAAKCPIKGITRISNVKFGEGLITTWRAYNIGRGKEFPIEHENNVSLNEKQVQKLLTLSSRKMLFFNE